MFNTGKNAWLDMKDTGKHAWWEHGKTPGHKALEGNLGMDLASAPGWGSLLPHSKHGVDTGLQCPMCINQRKFFA